MAYKSKLEPLSVRQQHPGIKIGKPLLGQEHFNGMANGGNKDHRRYGTEVLAQLAGITNSNEKMGFDPKLFECQEWCPVYQIGKTSNGGNVYFASINAQVDLLQEYVVLLNHLYEMGPNDIIEMNIDSPGGYITTATQICTAMRECKGRVITHASGLCASAGSLIWSCGDDVSVGDSALFMWHMSSHSDWGNSLGIRDEAEFQINYVRDALLDISLKRGFITEQEILKICENPDEAIWISAEEMRRRLADFENSKRAAE